MVNMLVSGTVNMGLSLVESQNFIEIDMKAEWLMGCLYDVATERIILY